MAVEPVLYLATGVIAVTTSPEHRYCTVDEIALKFAGINPDWCNRSVAEAVSAGLDNAQRAEGYLNQINAMIRNGEIVPCRRIKTPIQNPGFFDCLLNETTPTHSDPNMDTLYLDCSKVENFRATVVGETVKKQSDTKNLIIHSLCKIIKNNGVGKFSGSGSQNAIALEVERMAADELINNRGLSSSNVNEYLKIAREAHTDRKK